MRNYTLIMDQETREAWGIAEMSPHELESASATVAHLTRSATYPATTAGYPADPDLADVFAAATAAQAVYTAETGDPTGAGAIAGSMTLGPLSLTSRAGTGTKTLQQRSADLVSPKTVEILAAHGLLNGPVGNSAWR